MCDFGRMKSGQGVTLPAVRNSSFISGFLHCSYQTNLIQSDCKLSKQATRKINIFQSENTTFNSIHSVASNWQMITSFQITSSAFDAIEKPGQVADMFPSCDLPGLWGGAACFNDAADLSPD